MSSKKIGRPKIDNPKNIDIKVRLDEKTNKDILNYCEKNSLTRAEAIRQGIYLLLDKDEKKA